MKLFIQGTSQALSTCYKVVHANNKKMFQSFIEADLEAKPGIFPSMFKLEKSGEKKSPAKGIPYMLYTSKT